LIVADLADRTLPNERRLLAHRPEDVYRAYGHAGAAIRAQVWPNHFRH